MFSAKVRVRSKVFLPGIIIVVVIFVRIVATPMIRRPVLLLHDGLSFSACSGSIGAHDWQPRLFN